MGQRLGLIGGTDAKRTTGVYRPGDCVARQDAKRYLTRHGYDGVFNALASSGVEEAFDVSRDGRFVYVAVRGNRSTTRIFQYQCSVPWDLSTITYSSKLLDVGDYDINISGISISDDGTRLYFVGYQNDTVWSAILATPFDLATATVDVRRAYVGTQAASSATPFIGDGGTKLYVMSVGNDTVYQYTLATAWNAGTATYANKSLVISGIDIAPQGLFFKPDGTKLYIVGSTNTIVFSYTLSTAWDISTAVLDYSGKSVLVSAQATVPVGVYIGNAGQKMYVLNGATATTDTVFQYTLATAWDVTSATYDNKSFSVNTQELTTQALFFKDDGTKMYVIGQTNDTVYQYSLATAWDVSTASYDSVSFSVAGQEATPTGLFFSGDGTRMYVTGSTGDDVNQYSLSTAWDLSTASYVRVSAGIGDTLPTDLFFSSDGTRMYVVGTGLGAVREFSLSTAWDVSTISFVSTYPVTWLDTVPAGIFLKDDGTKFFMVGSTGDRVYELSLTQAWNINSVPGRWYVGNEELTPVSVWFKPDGAKMYLVGTTGDDVNEYDLSTAWDISTLSFLRVSAAVGEATPANLVLKDDGTKLYVIGATGDAIREFALSTAWDVSTLSFSKSLSVGFETTPSGLFFKDDGTQLYVCGQVNECVYQIPLQTAWDVGTARGYAYVGGTETVPRGISISGDGARLYLAGNGNSNVRQFSLGTAFELVGGALTLVASFAVSAVYGCHVNSDGTRIYVTVDSASTVAPTGSGRMVRVLHLSTPHDLNTASLDTKEWIPLYGLTGAAVTPWAVRLSPDETRMWVLGDVVAGLYQFSLRFA